MVVYASIPTKGVPAEDAKDLGEFLTFAGGVGQLPGLGVGQLPPGFLPMTSANGLGKFAAYTTSAATAVAAQNGTVPSVIVTVPTTGRTGTPSGGAGGSTPNAPTPSITVPVGPQGIVSNMATNGVPAKPAALIRTPGSLFLGSARVIVIVLGLATGCFGGPAVYLYGRRRGRW